MNIVKKLDFLNGKNFIVVIGKGKFNNYDILIDFLIRTQVPYVSLFES